MICTSKVRHFWRCIFLWVKQEEKTSFIVQNGIHVKIFLSLVFIIIHPFGVFFALHLLDDLFLYLVCYFLKKYAIMVKIGFLG